MLLQPKCPLCQSTDLSIFKYYNTAHNGTRKLFKCDECREHFSETKNSLLEGIRKPLSLIQQVLNARTEGMGLNAATRVFPVSKNTLLDWERKFSKLKDPLFTYSLTHDFIQQEIEGDELYTKVKENKPAHESEGWTIVFMERASRFIWELKCGSKDKALFTITLENLVKVIQKTDDLTLLTDGESRYGNILFELCHEAVHTGKRGRPKKTLRKGVKVRMKIKGSQNNKRGRKKKKYISAQPEHPETIQNISDKEIHANHVEAYNASLRRNNSTYRRKTNTYAKDKEPLQRTLDAQWVVHNFMKKHFTTKVVPAVALGIITTGLSWHDVFSLNILV